MCSLTQIVPLEAGAIPDDPPATPHSRMGLLFETGSEVQKAVVRPL